MSRAAAGAPGAGYCWSNSSWGKPPKSWMVFGLSIPVSHQPWVSQCAEMHRISWGWGSRPPNSLPRASQLRRYSLSPMAFIGLPWPTKSTGIRGLFLSPLMSARPAAELICVIPIPPAAIAPAAAMKFLRCI
jgi:hypothetical protein